MKRSLISFGLACMLCLTLVTQASADDGCGRALAATQGTPGHYWVALHCGQPDASGVTSNSGADVGLRSAEQGCAAGIAATQGTVAEPFVRAGCARAVASLTGAVQTDQDGGDPGPVNGCAIAHAQTAGTPGQAYVDAFCPGATEAISTASATSGAQSAEAGS